MKNLIYFTLLVLVSCKENDKNMNGNNFHSANDDVFLSEIFDVSGAKAVALTNKGIGVSANSNDQNELKKENDVMKILENGEYQTIFKKLNRNWNLKISVLEMGLDGSLYIGLDWGIWVKDHSFLGGKNVALFQILKTGETKVVDEDIHGMGQFYNKENLNKKQIQFDEEGSVYYLGRQGQTTVLKKKNKNNEISQIGNSRMEVRDFLVAKDGMVIFNGANKGDWDTQWLRIFNKDGAVTNVFYRDNTGWLKTYFLDKNNNLILVGDNLNLIDGKGIVKQYSGIMRVNLEQGKVKTIDKLIENFKIDEFSQISFNQTSQLLLSDSGALYAIVSHYDWQNSYVPNDKIVRILDDNQNVSLKVFKTHEHFAKIKSSKLIGNFLVYLSSNNGVSGIVKVNLLEDELTEELTGAKENIEIYSFIYHSHKKQILYDVYDLKDNTSYVVEQDLSTNNISDELNLRGLNIIDLVPFMYLYY